MKRMKAIKEITKILKKWEDCKLDDVVSDEILTKLEKLGIICPPPIIKKVHGKFFFDSDNKMVPLDEVECMEWEDKKYYIHYHDRIKEFTSRKKWIKAMRDL